MGPSTDVWNLGAILLEILDAVRISGGESPEDGSYKTKHYLEEMDALFGPFPGGYWNGGAALWWRNSLMRMEKSAIRFQSGQKPFWRIGLRVCPGVIRRSLSCFSRA